MTAEQLEEYIRDFVAERHDRSEVGVIEVTVRRPNGGILELIDLEPVPVSPSAT